MSLPNSITAQNGKIFRHTIRVRRPNRPHHPAGNFPQRKKD